MCVTYTEGAAQEFYENRFCEKLDKFRQVLSGIPKLSHIDIFIRSTDEIDQPTNQNGKKLNANVFSCDAIIRCEGKSGSTSLATDLLIESFGEKHKETNKQLFRNFFDEIKLLLDQDEVLIDEHTAD